MGSAKARSSAYRSCAVCDGTPEVDVVETGDGDGTGGTKGVLSQLVREVTGGREWRRWERVW
jgi:hypothetical protein